MSDRYPIPVGTARVQFTEKNSVFIGTAGPAPTVPQALDFIHRVAAEFSDAHHNAWAYLVGFGPRAAYASHNDGEPGGTAGPPALAALQGAGLGDVAVVVTRYFGGIKLGTGGLVRAYGRAAREAVAALPRGEMVARVSLSVTVAYHFHDTLQRLLGSYEAELVATDYGSEVRFELRLPADRAEAFARALQELTAGQAVVGPAQHV